MKLLSKKEEIKVYLISICYDGSFFSGWASQKNSLTVQDFIEKKLSKIFKSKIKILGASRTDKGVHAIDQKFTLKTSLKISILNLKVALTKSLKNFVDVKEVIEVNNDFHPINDVLSKEYRYYINTSDYNIFLKNYCWNYNHLIDEEKFFSFLKKFEGFHDFFNFSYCKTILKNNTNTKRKIEKIILTKEKNFLIIKIFAKGFLRYQIRAIIGESLYYYKDSNEKKRLAERLSGSCVNKYRKIAPSSGLYLWNIKYK